MAIGQELLNVPMGDMIRQMAFAIAEAQVALDKSSIDVAEMMGGLTTVYDEDGKITFNDSRVFFGYEYMTEADAKAYLAVEDAISGTQMADAMQKVFDADDDDDAARQVRVPTRVSMLELGFTPTFYQFVDTIIEVKIAIKITRESEYTRKKSDADTNTTKTKSGKVKFGFRSAKVTNTDRTNVSTSQVDASYSAKYGYSAEGSSLLRTKLTPLPPPPILEERIRGIMEGENARRAKQIEGKPSQGGGGGN